MGEFAGGAGIVRAVQVNVRSGLQFFEAAGPDRIGNPIGYGVSGDSKAAVLEETRSGDGGQGILELKTAREAGGDFENFVGIGFADPRADAAFFHGFTIDAKHLGWLNDRRTKFRGAGKNHSASCGDLFGENKRNSGLKDSGFFGSNFAQRVAEEVFVVEIDACDDGNNRRKNVSGIEAAAQADFEHSEFDALAGEILKGHGRDALEISGVSAKFGGGEEFLDQELDASEGVGKGFVGDLLAADADSFVDFFEVRRGIQSRSKAGVAKDGFKECGCRAFAVGAGNVCAGIGAVGAAEALGEDSDVLKIELCGGGLRRRSQFAAKREKVTDRGLVIHLSSRANRESSR